MFFRRKVAALLVVALASAEAGHRGHLDLLLLNLNWGGLQQEEISQLSSTIVAQLSSALGVRPADIEDTQGTPSTVSLQSGQTSNEYKPNTWYMPNHKRVQATLVSGMLELPSSVASIAESTLDSDVFESSLRQAVTQTIGNSTAVIGQLSVGAVTVYQKPDTDTITGEVPTEVVDYNGGQEKSNFLLYGGIGLGGLVVLGLLIWACFCCRDVFVKRRNTGQQLLQVTQYEDDVPIYEDPMKLFRSRQPGH